VLQNLFLPKPVNFLANLNIIAGNLECLIEELKAYFKLNCSLSKIPANVYDGCNN